MSNDTRNRLITALGLVALVLLSANIVTAVAHFTSHRHTGDFTHSERKACRKVEVRVHTEADTAPMELWFEAEQARVLAEMEAQIARIEAERTAMEMAQLQNLDQEHLRLETERAQVEEQYQRMMADLERELERARMELEQARQHPAN